MGRLEKRSLSHNIRSAFKSWLREMVGNTHFAYAVVNHGLESQESIANLLEEYETRLT